MSKATPSHQTTSEFELEPNTLVFEDQEHNYGYVVLSKLILYAANLSAEAKILYAYLLGYAYQEAHCFPGYGALCTDLGKTEKTVRNFMRELELANLLQQKRRGLGKTNIYVLSSLSKAKIQLQAHHAQSQNGKISRSGTVDFPVLEREQFPSNNKEIEELKDEEVYSSNTRKVDTVKNFEEAGSGSPSPSRVSPNQQSTEEATEQTSNIRTPHSNRQQPQSPAQKSSRAREQIHDSRTSSTSTGFQSIGSTLPTGGQSQPRARRAAPANDQDSDAYTAIMSMLDDIAQEFGDTASIKSTTTRAYNLYKQSGLSLDNFLNAIYQARAITKERSGSVKKGGILRIVQGDTSTDFPVKNKVPYFFSVLSQQVGLTDPPTPNSGNEHAH